jgi:hypothetical protein
MISVPAKRVGILWRGDREARASATASNSRLRAVFEALQARGIAAEPVVFDDDIADDVRAQLLALDGVLVWVDPVMGERDRRVLDALLREVADRGVWVSAHPDVILKIGTKDVLVLVRELSCGSDTVAYRTTAQFEAEFPRRLRESGPRVLKQRRGNGGIGVWKVQLAAGASKTGEVVEVQDARPRGIDVESMPLGEFMGRMGHYFADGGCLIDQPFQPRIAEGLVRCYLVRDEIAGFSTQGPDPAHVGSDRIFGLPAKKTMYPADEPRFARLRASMESEWLPSLQRLAGVGDHELPLLWDADFLYGPRDAHGEDTYVLCEINVSSVFPLPEQVPVALARAVEERLGQ